MTEPAESRLCRECRWYIDRYNRYGEEICARGWLAELDGCDHPKARHMVYSRETSCLSQRGIWQPESTQQCGQAGSWWAPQEAA